MKQEKEVSVDSYTFDADIEGWNRETTLTTVFDDVQREQSDGEVNVVVEEYILQTNNDAFYIDPRHVEALHKIICEEAQVGETTELRDFRRRLMNHHNITVRSKLSTETWQQLKNLSRRAHNEVLNTLRRSIEQQFNGGENRARQYFKYYYYPLKVLQGLGLVTQKGRMIRLNSCDDHSTTAYNLYTEEQQK